MTEDSFFNQFYEMNMWINAQLCRNPDREVNALASDFIMGYYGKAGPPLLSYLGLVRSRLPGFPFRTFDYEFMTQAQKRFDEAEAAVADNPEWLDRVKALRIQLDLAALVWRNSIIADYLAKGGKLEQYPWRIPVLKARLLATLDASRNLYVCGKTPRSDPKKKDHGDIPILTIVRRYIDEISRGVDYTPLPKELGNVALDRVIDLPAPLIAELNFPMLAPDPDATLGLAVPRMNTNECPMYLCYYSKVAGDSKSGGNPIAAKDVPGRGYHLYKGPRFSLSEWTFLYLTSSWQLQRHLFTLYDPANPKQEWDSYVSMKYTGPAYPFGDSGESNGLFIDRLILVKVE